MSSSKISLAIFNLFFDSSHPLESSPTLAADRAAAPSGSEEQAPGPQPRTTFTILRHGPGSASNNTSTERAGAIQAGEGFVAQEEVAGLTKSLEELEVGDDSNDTEDTALDEFLVGLLKNKQERIFLLKLDREFCNFLNNPAQEHLEFPSLNSYYRMVIHRVANYFKITRVVDPQQKIILFKTEQSAIPALRFPDLVEEEEEQPVKPMKVLKRNPNRSSSGVSTPDGTSEPDRKTISMEEREKAYAEARKRIFQEEAPSKPRSEGSGSNSRCDSPSVPAPAAEQTRQDGGDESVKSKNRKQSNGRKPGSGSARSPDELGDNDHRQHNQSSPNSRNVSRSTSPAPPSATGGSDSNPKASSKGLGPRTKLSKGDPAAECADQRRRKSTASTASSSSGTARTPVGLARTVSSSSSQDGFQSPSIGGANLTESPSVNSPSTPTASKTYDYFGQNPNPSSGSVSPMSSGSSRTSFSYPQPGGPKQIRNHHHHNNSGSGHNAGPSSGNFGNHLPNPGFVKGMNGGAFVPKKPYPKHHSSHMNSGGAFNSGSGGGYPTGPSTQGHPFNNNGANSPYTHSQPNVSSPWSDRSMAPGHEQTPFYNTPQDPSMTFQYGNNPGHYPQPGPNMQPPFSSNHHPNNQMHNNHQHIYHGSSHRGGRRNTSKPQFSHQPHFQHPHHSRTYPQMHPQQQQHHHGNSYSGPSTRDDFAYPQGAQAGMRYGRSFDSNPGQVPPQQYVPDFYPAHGMAGDGQSNPNIYPAFLGPQQAASTGETSPSGQRYPYNQNPNWNQGLNHGPNQGTDSASMLYNPALQPPIGGKKNFNSYQLSPSMMGPSQQGSMAIQSGMVMGGGGGHGMYDIERRPPKSAELFDPNGPSSSSSNGGGGQEAEKSPSLNHILEIHDFDAQDDIFEDLILPTGSRLRRVKSAKGPVDQCLVVFKNANLAAEALVAFQEGRETWMGPDARMTKEEAITEINADADAVADTDAGVPTGVEKDGEGISAGARLQQRFNVKVWTPVLHNNTTPVVAGGSACPVKSQSQAATATSAMSSDFSNGNGDSIRPCNDKMDAKEEDLSTASSGKQE
ncbi:hypothetical protein BGZ54_001650 [Gamsiella multidivaricata]|nr:hypothetical protein BGZ54_001650 [Gamsiella multidivaricata]